MAAGAVTALLLLLAPAPHAQRCTLPTLHRPKITIADYPNYYDSRDYYARYGDPITLVCSATNTNSLTIRNCISRTKEINGTTIQCTERMTVEQSKYDCVDSGTGCKDSLTVYTAPVLSIVSPRVHRRRRRTFGKFIYFVPRGEIFEMFCSGVDSESLRILAGKEIKTTIVNQTTVKYTTQVDRVEQKDYKCYGGSRLHEQIRLVVDEYPEALNFRCIFYGRSKLECLWSSSTEANTFTLFHKDEYYEDTRLFMDNSGEETVICKLSKFKGRDISSIGLTFELLLETCNVVFCNNQTFPINAKSITKLSTISYLQVFNTSSHYATLTWDVSYTSVEDVIKYKVEYRLTAIGEEWRQADMSSLDCYIVFDCKFQLALPYSASEYEAKVYARLVEATDDWLWSEPAHLSSIVTKPSVKECSCAAAPRASPAPITPGEATCEACELKEDMIEAFRALTKRKIRLRQKRDHIHRYAKALNDLQHALSIGTANR